MTAAPPPRAPGAQPTSPPAADPAAAVAALLRYFRDCLVADGGERELDDAFASGEREHHLVPLDAPDAAIETLTLPPAKGRALARAVRVQRQERELLLGWPFVCGPHPERSERRLRAPFFIAAARVEESWGDFRIVAEAGSLRINPVVLAALGLPRDDTVEADERDPRLAEAISRLLALRRIDLPAHAERLPTTRAATPALVSAAAVWMSQRSRVAASSAFELESMAAGGTFSPCLQQLLGQPPTTSSPGPEARPASVPARLSKAQEQALINAARYPLSVVHGAPGTGKTYTIAGIAADRVMRGERVLLVCGNEHAADVVFDKLAEAFAFGDDNHLVVRAGQGEYRQRLLRDLERLMATELPEQADTDVDRDTARDDPAVAAAARALEAGAKAHDKHTRRFRRALARAHGQAAWLLDERGGIGSVLRRWWLSRRQPRTTLLSEWWDACHAASDAHQQHARAYLHTRTQAARHALLRRHRRKLAALATALRSRNSGHRSERLEAMDWSVLTQAFPVWVASAQSLDRNLPLTQGLFDLVVIDEATQCNVALALPALQRAHRAVVVGDPRQLRHFSFLARRRQDEFAAEHGVEHLPVSLDYRERSLIDYAIDALPSNAAQVWLDEHFRSHPELIDFNNRRFYEGRLKILTDARRLDGQPPRRILTCPLRLEQGVNLGEVDAVVERLRELIARQADLPADEAASIGVVAMFAALAQALQARIQADIGLDALTRHNLLVATPYGFQGEERDLILLATGMHPQLSRPARQYMERPDVFNVATSRARHAQTLFIGEGSHPAPDDGLLGAYLAHRPSTATQPTMPDARAHDTPRQALAARLEQAGYRCWADFPLGGQAIDLLATSDTRAVAIDLVGIGGDRGHPWPQERYTVLERAGVLPHPVALTEWRWRADEVVARIVALLGDRANTPHSPAARRLARLRWQFDKLGHDSCAQLLDELERALATALSWLARRFEPGELTHARYADSIAAVVNDALDELDALRLVLEESRALALDQALLDERAERATDVARRTRDALDALSAGLALDDGWQASTLDQSLAELARLSARLSLYQPARTTTPPAHNAAPPGGA